VNQPILISSPGRYENQPDTTIADCFAGAERNLDLVRHWREALLVGVTRWCADVAPAGKLPKLGDCWHTDSVDEILRLKPTLVIGSVRTSKRLS